MNVDFNHVVFFIQWWWVGFDLQFGHTTWGPHSEFIHDGFVLLDSKFLSQNKENHLSFGVKTIKTLQYVRNVINANLYVALRDCLRFLICFAGCNRTTRRHGS